MTYTHHIQVGNFALCGLDAEGGARCARTQDMSASDLQPIFLGGREDTSGGNEDGVVKNGIELALEAQKKLFFGTPVLSMIFVCFTLFCVFVSHFTVASSPFYSKLRITSALLAALGTTIMLVDGFSTKLVSSALGLANWSVKGENDFDFEFGRSYVVLQWMAFVFGLVAVGASILRFIVANGKNVGGMVVVEREPMLPRHGVVERETSAMLPRAVVEGETHTVFPRVVVEEERGGT